MNIEQHRERDAKAKIAFFEGNGAHPHGKSGHNISDALLSSRVDDTSRKPNAYLFSEYGNLSGHIEPDRGPVDFMNYYQHGRSRP